MNNNYNNKELAGKEKNDNNKWNIYIIMSLVVFILGVLLVNSFPYAGTVWMIGRILLFSSLAVFIISVIISLYLKKKSGKVPAWVNIIIGIIITCVILFIIGKIYQYKFRSNEEEYEKNITIYPEDL